VLQWLSNFRAAADARGRFGTANSLAPSSYGASYDLRKRRNSRLDIQYMPHQPGMIAERGASDTSSKPILAESLRQNTLDPLSALSAIRHELQADGGTSHHYVVPVFDGVRRFDVIADVAPAASDRLVWLNLTFRQIAGFDEKRDSALGPMQVGFSNDALRIPVLLHLSVGYFPVEVRLRHLCSGQAKCQQGAG
jgi:hypothetical protein